MSAEDAVGLLIPATYLVLLALERLFPARQQPARRGWTWIGIGCLLLTGALASLLPLLVPEAWLHEHRLLDGTRLGVAGGTLVGWIVFSAFAYAWHRAEHAFAPLWRGVHQLHHSPQRLDVSGALFFHPVEIVLQMLLAMLVGSLLLGLQPLAAALLGYVSAFHAMFQHLNLRTPRWLGYVIQRPEAHDVHHRMGLHAYNYGDFPLWDLLLGTWRNPARFGEYGDGRVGFESPADRQVAAMLAFRDVNAPLYGAGSRGAAAGAAAPSAG